MVVPRFPPCVQPALTVTEVAVTTAGLKPIVTSNPLSVSDPPSATLTGEVMDPPAAALPPATVMDVPADAPLAPTLNKMAPIANRPPMSGIRQRRSGEVLVIQCFLVFCGGVAG
jgi:hypothetical protein